MGKAEYKESTHSLSLIIKFWCCLFEVVSSLDLFFKRLVQVLSSNILAESSTLGEGAIVRNFLMAGAICCRCCYACVLAV